mgnify:CR=1 FL=1
MAGSGTGTAVRKIDNFGVGCAPQALGALVGAGALVYGLNQRHPAMLFWSLVIGVTFIVVGLIVGRRLSTRWSCSVCGNPIQGADVKLCPTCRVPLGKG